MNKEVTINLFFFFFETYFALCIKVLGTGDLLHIIYHI